MFLKQRHAASMAIAVHINCQVGEVPVAGSVLNYSGVAAPTPAEITQGASRVLSFIDLGGHERFMKTALYGAPHGHSTCEDELIYTSVVSCSCIVVGTDTSSFSAASLYCATFFIWARHDCGLSQLRSLYESVLFSVRVCLL